MGRKKLLYGWKQIEGRKEERREHNKKEGMDVKKQRKREENTAKKETKNIKEEKIEREITDKSKQKERTSKE
jgi:hypothetical protein